ncbi:hypothetical protein C8R47DRAFT_561434 [Mycena vitilis]|nr:hypothetical protein C8R47DRAFT_561434 [Mycena vitilis]
MVCLTCLSFAATTGPIRNLNALLMLIVLSQDKYSKGLPLANINSPLPRSNLLRSSSPLPPSFATLSSLNSPRMSVSSIPGAQEATRSSIDFFGGSSLCMDDPVFGRPGFRSSFSFGSADSQWSAVTKAKEAQPVSHSFLWQRKDSVASNFTSMTGDELSDEVDPWTLGTDARFDFGFSAALRDSCLYTVPREYLPSDDSDAGDDSDTAIDTDTEEEVLEEEPVQEEAVQEEAIQEEAIQEEAMDDVSDTDTLCADEPEPEFWVADVPEAAPCTDLPWLSWLTTPSRPTAPLPRRSGRAPRPSRRMAAEPLSPQTPTKRKRPAPKDAKSPPSKKVALVGKADKPTARAVTRSSAVRPSTSTSTSPNKGKGKTHAVSKKARRVVLRV